MAFKQRAKITVELDRLGYVKSKYFIGTEDEVLREAHDWMHAVALQFIEENDIEDEYEQNLIIDAATHTIEWEVEEPIYMYAVYENDNAEDPVYGVYSSRADAEEAILTECEDCAYKIMMTADPLDVFGCAEWDWKIDYKWLVEDAMKTFAIQEVPVFGIEEVIK